MKTTQAKNASVRKTKIIATLGPVTSSPEMIGRLITAGMNVARLNMSHGSHDWVRRVVKDLRAAATAYHCSVGILMDTQGPAIRTGDMPADLNLMPGEKVTLTVRGAKCVESHSVDVNYDNLVNDISVDDVVLVNNGAIRMKVLSKSANQIECEVLTEGTLRSRCHINLPGVRVNLSALTPKDLADVQLGLELGVDFIALSFTREAADVARLRSIIERVPPCPLIVSKIEDQEAVKNLDEIVHEADAIMLSGETTTGKYPVHCVETFDQIARRVELEAPTSRREESLITSVR